MNPFAAIVRNLDKLQQHVNFQPQEQKVRKTKRSVFTYEQ